MTTICQEPSFTFVLVVKIPPFKKQHHRTRPVAKAAELSITDTPMPNDFLILKFKKASLRRGFVVMVFTLLLFVIIPSALNVSAPITTIGQTLVGNVATWKVPNVVEINVTPANQSALSSYHLFPVYITYPTLRWEASPITANIAFVFYSNITAQLDVWKNYSHTQSCNYNPYNISTFYGNSSSWLNRTEYSYDCLNATFFDWQKVSSLGHATANLGGKSIYAYYVKDVPLATNQTIRARMVVMADAVASSTEYLICGDLSSDTLSQAISNNRLYCVDPVVGGNLTGNTEYGHWTFNNTLNNSAVNGNQSLNWTLAAGTMLYADGKNQSSTTNASLKFDGSTRYNFSDKFNSILACTTGCTWTAWVNISDAVTANAGIIETASATDDALTFKVDFNDAHKIRLVTGNTLRCTSAFAATYNRYFHVTVSYNGSHASLLINGTEDPNCDTLSVGSLGTPIGPVYLGDNVLASHIYFIGSIDNLRFYNDTLTPSQISAIIGAGMVGNESSILPQAAAASTTPPSFVNSSNNTAPLFGQVFGYSVNITANTGTLAGGFVTLIHNMTTYGTSTNVTVPMSGSNFNVTFNITNNLKYSGSSRLNVTGINITANDSGNNINMTLAALFTIANTAPAGAPVFVSPPNVSFFNTTSITVNVTNGSDADGNPLNVSWSLNDLYNTTTTSNFTFTGLNNGNYSVRAFFTDGYNAGQNSTNTLNFTIDTIAPTISFIANTPANNSIVTNNSIFINTSENDAGNDHNDFSAFVDFNNSLLGYWRLEDGSGTTAADSGDTGNASYAGTLTSFGCTDADCNASSGWVSNGKRGKAISFDGGNDRVVTGVKDLPTTNMTLEGWLYSEDNSGRFFCYGACGAGSDVLSVYSGGFIIRDSAGTTGDICSGLYTPTQQWHHFALVMGPPNATAYIDGVLCGTSKLSAYSINPTTQKAFTFGADFDGSSAFKGKLDEIRIWNRMLSVQEINASFSAGSYRLFSNLTNLADGNYTAKAYTVDAAGNMNSTENRTFNILTNTAPTIQLIFPTNGTNTSRNNINFSAFDAESNPLTCSLFVNGTFNQSNNCLTNMTLAAAPEKNYVINVSAFDGSLYSPNISVSYTFDNLTPLLNNATNSNATIGNPIYVPKNSVFLNFTYTEPLNSTFTIQNGTSGINNNITSAITANAGAFWFTFTGLNDANYSFMGYVNDTAGNYNRTGNISIAIDTTLPVVLLAPPTPANNSFTANNRVNISTNVTETNFQNMTINIFNQTGLLNRTGFTKPNSSINYTLNDGIYQISITAYDLANNSNTSLPINFTVDTISPNVSLELPVQNGKVDKTFVMQFQANDSIGISQCNITSGVLGTISNGTVLNISNGQENTFVNSSSLHVGDQVLWRVDCLDFAGNTGSSATQAFTIAPSLSSGTGEGGGGVISLGEPQPAPCKEGEQSYYVNGTRYCVICDGKIEALDSPYNVSCVNIIKKQTQTTVQQPNGTSANQYVIIAAAVAVFVLLATNFFQPKKQVKKIGR